MGRGSGPFLLDDTSPPDFLETDRWAKGGRRTERESFRQLDKQRGNEMYDMHAETRGVVCAVLFASFGSVGDVGVSHSAPSLCVSRQGDPVPASCLIPFSPRLLLVTPTSSHPSSPSNPFPAWKRPRSHRLTTCLRTQHTPFTAPSSRASTPLPRPRPPAPPPWCAPRLSTTPHACMKPACLPTHNDAETTHHTERAHCAYSPSAMGRPRSRFQTLRTVAPSPMCSYSPRPFW